MRVRDFWPHVVSSSEGKEAKCAMTLVMTPLYIKLGFMLVLGLNIDENAANILLCTYFNYSSVSDRNKQFH